MMKKFKFALLLCDALCISIGEKPGDEMNPAMTSQQMAANASHEDRPIH